MRRFPALAFVSLLAAVPALRGDLPTPEVFAVVVDGGTVTTALVYHWDAVVRGRDPVSGEIVIASIPEWHRLEIEGERYRFHLRSSYDRDDPFAPGWTLALDDVAFSWPAVLRDPAICRAAPRRLELRLLPDAEPDCSGVLEGDRDRCDDCDDCDLAYRRNFHACPSLFGVLEEPVQGTIEPFEALIAARRARPDWRARDAVLTSCSEGGHTACAQVFSRYAQIRPESPDALCDQRVGDRDLGCPGCADERECAFSAFFEAVTMGCSPPACAAECRWSGRVGSALESPVWRPVPRLFPYADDPRLIAAESW